MCNFSRTREKAPVFTLGNPNPRSFSRGKRGIAGSLVFTVFDKDAMRDIKNATKVARQGLNDTMAGIGLNPIGVNIPHQNMGADENYNRWVNWQTPHYSDEIPPLTNLQVA